MLGFASGISTSVNSKKAIAEALEHAVGDRGDEVTLVILHATMGHNLEVLLAGVAERCPEADVVGCTGSGVVGHAHVSEAMRALSVMAITGEGISLASMAGVTATTSGDIARQCAEKISADLEGINMILALGPGLDVDGDATIEGIESVFGAGVPMFGALSGFSGEEPRTPIFHGDRVLDGALVLVGLSDPSLSLVQGAHHGNLAQEGYRFTVTKAEGVRVDELDGKPAWPTLMSSLDLPSETTPMEIIPVLGLGTDLGEEDQIEYDNAQILHAPLHLGENGTSIFMQASVPVGVTLVSCQRDEQHIFDGVDRLTRKLRDRIGDRRPVAVFHADCMARGRLAHDAVAKNEIVSEIQRGLLGETQVPWLGVYGFAEFCALNGRNRFHNYTTALSVLVRDADADSARE